MATKRGVDRRIPRECPILPPGAREIVCGYPEGGYPLRFPWICEEQPVPRAKKTSRGGSKRGKLKIGKNRKGWSHSQKRNTVKKALKRD